MKENIKTLYDDMIEELSLYSDMGGLPVRRLAGKLNVVNRVMADLKKFIGENPFSDQQEEVNFFKYEKPLFVCELLCAHQMFTIETHSRQFTEATLIRNYYEQELKVIKHYFMQHQFLYQYYLLEASELDNILFVRGAEASATLLPETPDLDPEYATKGDHLFAQFLAHEKVQDYLINELYPSSERVRSGKVLHWTGETVNLVELAYGLYLTGQLNNGKATIVEIIKWLEMQFNVDVGNGYRRWHAISNRKRITPTKFIDQMREAINRKLDDDNDLNKGK
ncbi:MAG TPA: RteC domain-containing protein [Mucilaginibacter sp.]|jgi:hypothetical protein|nr:RteC domain-containing protein [Mucilaginibacter sp.]